MGSDVVALVGAAGGVGTTRLAVETGAALAADDRDAVVLDAAVGTQGMAAYLPDRIEPDITTVLLEEAELGAAVHDHPSETPGRLGLCPAFAPFTRLAAVQAPETAAQFEDLVEAARATGDGVVIDVPPLADNLAVAAVSAADRVGVVTEQSARGRDALSRCRGRLADVGVDADFVVGNRVGEEAFPDADVSVGVSREADVPETPTVLQGDDGVGPGVAALVETGFDMELGVSLETGLLGSAREYLS
ncbi:MAG: AAA family ATPase [Halobacteriaceae archaeon]